MAEEQSTLVVKKGEMQAEYHEADTDVLRDLLIIAFAELARAPAARTRLLDTLDAFGKRIERMEANSISVTSKEQATRRKEMLLYFRTLVQTGFDVLE